jgi:hypothetical protein
MPISASACRKDMQLKVRLSATQLFGREELRRKPEPALDLDRRPRASAQDCGSCGKLCCHRHEGSAPRVLSRTASLLERSRSAGRSRPRAYRRSGADRSLGTLNRALDFAPELMEERDTGQALAGRSGGRDMTVMRKGSGEVWRSRRGTASA